MSPKHSHCIAIMTDTIVQSWILFTEMVFPSYLSSKGVISEPLLIVKFAKRKKYLFLAIKPA
jgi:hypothetical protein